MSRLIKLQLRIIIQSKIFYICMALMILLGPVATAILSNSLADIIKTTSICNEILSILSISIVETIFIVLITCNDYADGTTKNIIARGYTRTQLLFSKYIAILLSLFLMYAITILCTFIILYNKGLGYKSTMGYQFINNIVMIIAYTVFYTTMAFLLEKNGSGIIACLFVPQLLPTLMTLLNKVIKFDFYKLWMEHGSELFEKKPTLGNLGISVLYYGVYIVIFIIIGTQILKRKEIK